MSRKTLTIGLSIIGICLLIVAVGLIVNRSTSREPSAEELTRYGQYQMDVTQERILAECTYQEEKVIGQNTYRIYDSGTLPGLLYACGEIQQIAMDAGDTLYIQYTDVDGRNVTLAYNQKGLAETGIYDPETDTFFHKDGEQTMVWEKFRSGIQWGG